MAIFNNDETYTSLQVETMIKEKTVELNKTINQQKLDLAKVEKSQKVSEEAKQRAEVEKQKAVETLANLQTKQASLLTELNEVTDAFETYQADHQNLSETELKAIVDEAIVTATKALTQKLVVSEEATKALDAELAQIYDDVMDKPGIIRVRSVRLSNMKLSDSGILNENDDQEVKSVTIHAPFSKPIGRMIAKGLHGVMVDTQVAKKSESVNGKLEKAGPTKANKGQA